eukprot:gene10621-9331_t
MGEVVNSLTVANKLRELSRDEGSRPYIVRRGILPTLKKLLEADEYEVTLVTAQNPAYIRREKKLMETVCQLYTNPECPADIKELLGTALKNLSPKSSSKENLPP